MELSEEQRAVVEDLCVRNLHVFVDAVAGSGKTTTILGVAAALKSADRVLLLTYNAKLKFETRTRVAALGLSERLHVHSYHSAALNIYHDAACKRDEGIAALLARQPHTTSTTPSYDVLVIDEVQDMTPLYHRLVGALVKDVCVPHVRLLVLGDRRQAIYQFKGSDARFLTLAPSVFGPFTDARMPRKWVERTLSTTYRLTPQCASFVNMQILGACSMTAVRLPDGGPAMTSAAARCGGAGGPRPRYLVCNAFGGGPFAEVRRWLKLGVQPGEIFVLAPSTRNNALVRQLENRMVKHGIMCYATSSDDAGSEVQDERVTRGKAVFATFHQAKGLERRAVMVFGFDASYMTFHHRTSDACADVPNPIYVAVTRTTEHLSLVHHCENGPLPIIRAARLLNDCEVVVPAGEEAAMEKKRSKAMPFLAAAKERRPLATSSTPLARRDRVKHPLAVTDVLRFMADDVMARATAMLTFKTQATCADPCCTSAAPPPQALVTSVDGETAESVAALTGIALPAIFEARLVDGATSILRHAARHAASLPPPHRRRIEKLMSYGGARMSVSDHLYVANVYHALTTGFRCKLQQVVVYDWLNAATVDAALATLFRNVTGDAVGRDGVARRGPALALTFEVSLTHDSTASRVPLSRSMAGVADLIDRVNDTLWEFKCTAAGDQTQEGGGFDAEHKLQLAMYAFMHHRGSPYDASGFHYKLLNILSGDVVELVYDEASARAAIELLLAARTWSSSSRGSREDDDAEDEGETNSAFLTRISSFPESTFGRSTEAPCSSDCGTPTAAMQCMFVMDDA